jgi:hypothetical protein
MGNAMSAWERGMVAPADGNAAGESYAAGAEPLRRDELGPNLERLDDERPDLVNALRELVREYRQERALQHSGGTYEYGIPPIYADPQVLDFDSIGRQNLELGWLSRTMSRASSLTEKVTTTLSRQL